MTFEWIRNDYGYGVNAAGEKVALEEQEAFLGLMPDGSIVELVMFHGEEGPYYRRAGDAEAPTHFAKKPAPPDRLMEDLRAERRRYENLHTQALVAVNAEHQARIDRWIRENRERLEALEREVRDRESHAQAEPSTRERELNQKVTAAILRAEHLPEGAERERAFAIVSSIEEELATLTWASSPQGQAARLGAVLAARSARDPLRAQELAARYLAEEIPGRLRSCLAIEQDLIMRSDMKEHA